MAKKIIKFMLAIVGSLFFLSNEKVFAIKNIPDGNATWDNGYRPSEHVSGSRTHARDVPQNIKAAWEQDRITQGGKFPDRLYNPRNENLFMYDVYSKNLNNTGKGWQIFSAGTGNNREDFFSFDGWSVNAGYHHHTLGNQATYIGVINTRSKERKIYKAMTLPGYSGKPYSIINSKTGESFRRCANNEYRVDVTTTGNKSNGQTIACNMDYDSIAFRAFIPLNELFTDPKNTNEWEFYIIKNIEGILVYDQIVLPFNESGIDWENEGRKGELNLRSQLDNDHLIAIDGITIKYKSAAGEYNASLGSFNKGKTYKRTGQNENFVLTWYQVRDNIAPNASNELRWARSSNWYFGGSIATLSYKPKPIPDPSHIVEREGSTEGRAKGEMQWYLNKTKDDSPSELVLENNAEIDGEHYATRDADKRIHIKFPNDTYNDITASYKATFPNPNILKKGKATYKFDYEYTNHYKRNYECVDSQGSDCFEWKYKNDTPVWDDKHTKKASWEVELPIDHQYGETIDVESKGEIPTIELTIGRTATLQGSEKEELETDEFKEEFEFEAPYITLQSQTFLPMEQKINYQSDLENKIYYLEDKMHVLPYPDLLDNNLKEKYTTDRNLNGLGLGEYLLPLRVGKKEDSMIHFKLADVFYVTKATGFQFSLPFEEQSILEINKTAKHEYEAYTGETYDDEVLTPHNDLSFLFINIDGNMKQFPSNSDGSMSVYHLNLFELSKLGLSDIEFKVLGNFHFNQYLIGSIFDNALIAELPASVKEDVTYTHSITLTPEQIEEVKEIAKERGMLLHSFRSSDIYRKYNELKSILPTFDE